MRKLSKLLALLLVLAMVFSLTGCSVFLREFANNQTDAGKLLGKWVYRVDLSDFMGEMLSDMLDTDAIAPNTTLYMNLTLDFDREAFEMVAEIDIDSLEEYAEDLIDNLMDYVYDMMEDQGISREELEDQIELLYGMSFEQYVHDQMQQSLSESLDDMSSKWTGYYRLDEENGYIYVGEDEDDLDSEENAMEYRFRGSKLIISEVISEGDEIDIPKDLAQIGFELPWEFERD